MSHNKTDSFYRAAPFQIDVACCWLATCDFEFEFFYRAKMRFIVRNRKIFVRTASDNEVAIRSRSIFFEKMDHSEEAEWKRFQECQCGPASVNSAVILSPPIEPLAAPSTPTMLPPQPKAQPRNCNGTP